MKSLVTTLLQSLYRIGVPMGISGFASTCIIAVTFHEDILRHQHRRKMSGIVYCSAVVTQARSRPLSPASSGTQDNKTPTNLMKT